jgi:hypothetical protein
MHLAPLLVAAATLLAAGATAQAALFTEASAPEHIRRWERAEAAANATIRSSRFVHVDVAALRRSSAGAELALDVGGSRATFRVTEASRSLGHLVRVGRVDGAALTTVLVVGPSGAAAGHVELGGDRTFALAYTGHAGVHSLRQLDLARLGDVAPTFCATDASHAVAVPGAAAPPPVLLDPGAPTTIDVAFFYTAAARAAGGGTAALQAELVLRLANANAANVASGVGQRFRAVHMAETSYAETGSSDDLGRFQDGTDGYMDEVHAARAIHGADLMCLITNPTTLQYCGIGFLMQTLSPTFGRFAFSVSVRSCLGGHTLTHEMGHNLGCHHDRANAGPALFPYSYGFRTSDNNYRTIMAYAPGTRVNVWSSPLVQHLGYTMGVPDREDNARSLNDARPATSQFFATRTLEWCDLPGGIPGVNGLPTLEGRGTIDNAVPITVTVDRMPAGGPGVFILGTREINLPLFGGTLVPDVVIAVPFVGTAAPLPLGLAGIAAAPRGTSIISQVFFVDAAAPQGISASDALKTVIP